MYIHAELRNKLARVASILEIKLRFVQAIVIKEYWQRWQSESSFKNSTLKHQNWKETEDQVKQICCPEEVVAKIENKLDVIDREYHPF